jgi:glycosyltransferase involved in cell wall biosynthesis
MMLQTPFPPDGDPPEVSVVVPVYGNEASLRELDGRIARALDGARRRHERILVLDASPDDSVSVARGLASEDERVGWLDLAANVGQHRAFRTGLVHSRGHWVVTLDADLQDPPEAIPELLETAERGWDAVFAGRRGSFQSGGRMLTSRFFKRVQEALTGVPRDAGMFHVASRRLVDRVLDFPDHLRFHLPQVGLAGLPMTSIPVTRESRGEGESSYTGWRRLRMGLEVTTFALRMRLGFGPGRSRGSDPVRVGRRGGVCAVPPELPAWVVG